MQTETASELQSQQKKVLPRLKSLLYKHVATNSQFPHRLIWLTALVPVLFAVYVRIRLLSIPLERDEGEFAYMGQLILQGIPPYELAYNMKFPGVYAAYALIMGLFGQTTTAIHFGLLLVNIASAVLLFFIARRLMGTWVGIISAVTFVLLSVSPGVLGTQAHATHFIMLPALGGILLLMRCKEEIRFRTIFIAGFLLGLSVIMKQPGLFFVVFGLLLLVSPDLRAKPVRITQAAKNAGVYLFGAALPFVITCAVLYKAGVFSRFWFWTFTYGREYATNTPFSDAPQIFLSNSAYTIGPHFLMWILAGIGLTAIAWEKQVRGNAAFISGLFVFSFLAMCPGFHFREHYYILILPVIGICVGAAVISAGSLLQKFGASRLSLVLPVALFAVSCVWPVLQQRDFYFYLSPRQANILMYGKNLFPESIDVAEYIKKHTNKNDRIAVVGSEPQIYFYSGRHSATGYIYTYGLMENHPYALKMQHEMIRQIESARPKYLVFVNVRTSWLPRPDSDITIVKWCSKYCSEYYDLEGVQDILAPNCTVSLWGDDARDYEPSPWSMLVYKRKG